MRESNGENTARKPQQTTSKMFHARNLAPYLAVGIWIVMLWFFFHCIVQSAKRGNPQAPFFKKTKAQRARPIFGRGQDAKLLKKKKSKSF